MSALWLDSLVFSSVSSVVYICQRGVRAAVKPSGEPLRKGGQALRLRSAHSQVRSPDP